MHKREEVIKIIATALEEINKDREGSFEISENLRLMGTEGVLDSMDVVNLTVEVEEKLADTLDLDVTIASEKAFSRKKSPFYDVGSLANFILELSEGAP